MDGLLEARGGSRGGFCGEHRAYVKLYIEAFLEVWGCSCLALTHPPSPPQPLNSSVVG